jgi:toxin CptA
MGRAQTLKGSVAGPLERTSARTRARFDWLPLALIFLLALPALWYSLIAAETLRVEVGDWGDQTFLTGVYDPEQNPSENYRWSTDRVELVVPNLSARYGQLRMRATGWRPPEGQPPVVQVDVDGQPWASLPMDRPMRTFTMLLPTNSTSANLHLTFHSDTYASPTDPRRVGFAIDWIELGAASQTGPAPPQLLGQALLLALALVLVRELLLPRGWQLASGAVLAAALLAANFWQPLWVSQALWAWLAIAAALLAASWLLAPRFARLLSDWMTPRQAGVAWALLVAALALRLLGATHPLFDIHDLGFHRPWLTTVMRGELYIFSTPSEFQNREIFNPPAGYLLMAPLQLFLPSVKLSVQVATGLVDWLGCLLLLALARELGLSARAGLLALALYAALPINTTMLWWGFVTNDMAQTSGLLLFWALLRLARRPDRAGWAIFTFAVAASLLMHIGAVVLTIGLLAGTLVLGWLRLTPRVRWAAASGFALAAALTGLVYFLAVASPAIAQPSDETAAALRETGGEAAIDLATRLWLVSRGVDFGYTWLLAALAPLGYAQLLRVRPRHPLGRVLVVAWLLICLGFFGVYLGLGLLVRYLYFAAPLAALGLGVLLDGLWRRRGQVVVTAIVLLVAWSGIALWVGGVLMRIKPSLVPLTH